MLIFKSATEIDHEQSYPIAGLIYDSAPELFTLMFGRQAIKLLARLGQGKQNRFSTRYSYVASLSGQVLGIALMLPASEVKNNLDYQHLLNFWERGRLYLANKLILNRLLRHDYPDDSFYIANLAVALEHRGKGIGSQLLNRCLTQAKKQGATSVWISVDIHNGRAQKLYESLGFKVVESRIINLFGQKVGSRVLVNFLEFAQF